MKAKRTGWPTVIVLAVVPLALAVLAILAGGREDRAQAYHGYHQGDIDCLFGVDTRDVIGLLGVIADVKGAPRNCVDSDGYSDGGCITPVIPNPTACDILYPNYITISPHEDLPSRYDINCDGEVNVFDVLRLLLVASNYPEELPTCAPTGTPG